MPEQKFLRAITTVFILVLCTISTGPVFAAQEPPSPASPALGEPASLSEPGELAPQYTGCGGVSVAVVNAAWEQEVFALVNAERAAAGLPPFRRSSALDSAARYHAADMAQDGYFDHNSFDKSGSTLVKVCDWSVRVGSYYSGWNSLAENIAWGYSSPASVMAAWMNSSGHRANILSTSNWEIGVGFFAGGPNGLYWAEDFGRKSGVYPLVINADAPVASSPAVNLYQYGDWDEYRLKNDAGAWTAWMPFQASSSWTLPPDGGLHTISAEMRKGTQTAATSDTIYLDAAAPTLLPRAFMPMLVR